MNYQTYPPGDELNGFVKCYWTLESPAGEHPQKQRIVPDGCMEMIFHYGGLYRQFVNGGTILQPRCFVIGQLTEPLEIMPTGSTGIFSARFHPEGFMPFATMPIRQMENTAVPLEQLYGAEGALLGGKMQGAASAAERIVILEQFLLGRLMRADTIDNIAKTTAEIILGMNGQVSVAGLSAQIKISRRQLERKFSTVIGLSPKQLAKIIRLQAALKLLLSGRFTSLTELAHEGDYYDQAHFIKDFKEFTGHTPRNFYGDHLKMSALFYTEG